MLAARKEVPALTREIRIIAWWGYLFAAISVVVTVPYFYFHANLPGPHAEPFRALLTVVASSIIAFFILLAGYVNRDAKRRQMNSALWTALVIFIPNAIGFILYFLLRQPMLIQCPQCGGLTNPTFNYCPKCKFSLKPTCPKCNHSVGTTDTFCPYCAHELKPATG